MDSTPKIEPTPGPIANAWTAYMDHMIEAGCPQKDREGLQYAFHAGAGFVLDMLDRLGEPDMPQEQCEAILDHMHKDMEAFVQLSKQKYELRRRRN